MMRYLAIKIKMEMLYMHIGFLCGFKYVVLLTRRLI